MRLFFALLKWIIISVSALVSLVILLLALDRDSRSVVLSEAQKSQIHAQAVYMPTADSSLYYELLAHYGKDKNLAPGSGYELQCLLAISHYPELVETPIDFLKATCI